MKFGRSTKQIALVVVERNSLGRTGYQGAGRKRRCIRFGGVTTSVAFDTSEARISGAAYYQIPT